ncbi:MAG: glycosyltransferase [Rhodospirillales bacterium]|nr:glycosyltransferase [Rhodospirillales bacterium]
MPQTTVPSTPLSVGVLVDLEKIPGAGGHVKCWERFAGAAVGLDETIDLTVYFLGETFHCENLSEWVRYVTLPPVLGTRRFSFLDQGAGHTDLAPYHPGLARRLAGREVIHATSMFGFGSTGATVAKRTAKPLVFSIHTDLPAFSSIYMTEIVERVAGNGNISQLLLDRLRINERAAGFMGYMENRLLRSCDRILVSKQEDMDRARKIKPPDRISFFRRGIDLDLFHPSRRAPERLRQDLGIDAKTPVLLFAGRIDASKQVMTLAAAARILIERNIPVHTVFAGKGNQMDNVRDLLGPDVTMLGDISQAQLAALYASADLFVFPSRSEVSPNVVLEAKASGLPPIVANANGGGQFIEKSGNDGLIVQDNLPQSWANTISPVLADPAWRDAMSRSARRWVERRWPSWTEVLLEDLIPVWRSARDSMPPVQDR